jgi:hypothetical protein
VNERIDKVEAMMFDIMEMLREVHSTMERTNATMRSELPMSYP